MKILTDAAYKILEGQLEYWKQAYENERARADRLTDNFLQSNGIQPVIEKPTTLKHEKAEMERMAEIKKSIEELLLDEVGQVELDLEEVEELQNAGVKVQNTAPKQE